LGNLASPTASMKTGLGDDYVEIGVPLDEFFGAIAWIDYGGIDSNENLYPIYTLSSPITVPAPEPSTLLLLGIGAASLLAYAWRRRTRTA